MSANAQQIITDRPDQTESSSTVPKSSLQIESGILLAFTQEDKIQNRQWIAPTNLFRLGITDGIELRILNQFESNKSSKKTQAFIGISDLEIGTKIQLLKKEDVNTEIAFLTHLVIPTGTESISSNQFGTINKLSFSHELSPNSGVGYNVGYKYFGKEAGDLTYSIAYGVGLNDKLSVYVEPYGEFQNMKAFISNFDMGFTYLIQSNLQFDFSFGLGLNEDMNYISTGISWNSKRY